MVADGGGNLTFFERNEFRIFVNKFSYLAHPPDPLNKNPKFGSLHLHAEIWSCVFSPKSTDSWASVSEDQTCRIWKGSNAKPELLQVLKGHELAVTSVDWKEMSKSAGSEVLVTCSDDQTFRIYNPEKDFSLVFCGNVHFLQEWQTLTYLALETHGDFLAIVSQTGYLFIFDLSTRQFFFKNKIHLGGIEGLQWQNELIVTCGSDNLVSIIPSKKTIK